MKDKVRKINVYLVFFDIFLNNLWTRVLKSVIIILERYLDFLCWRRGGANEKESKMICNCISGSHIYAWYVGTGIGRK